MMDATKKRDKYMHNIFDYINKHDWIKIALTGLLLWGTAELITGGKYDPMNEFRFSGECDIYDPLRGC